MKKDNFYTFDDIYMGESIVRDVLHPGIKRVVDYNGITILNGEYQVSIAQVHYLDQVIRPVRDLLLKLSDKTELPSYDNVDGLPMDILQKDEIVQYKRALKDLPNTIMNNGYTDLSFPEPPNFMPDEYLQDVQDIITQKMIEYRLELLKKWTIFNTL